MKIAIIVIAIAFLASADATGKKANSTSASVTKTKDARGKRNLNYFGNFGSNRREYNYQPSGYNYEPNNYIGGGSAPDYHHPEPPEPIIEIIIQDSNETLPEPQPIIQSNGKKKKEQVQVFYVKYHKDEKKGLVIHEPVAALSPAGHEQHDEEVHDDPIIVTPVPSIPRKATTLRTIIRPESEQYESSHGVHVTFNKPHNHHSKSDNHIHDEDKVESAIQPVIQLPQSRIGPLPVVPLKEKRQQPPQVTQGRVINAPPNHGNFHQPPQALIQQSLPHQRPHVDFNPQNNFVSQSQPGFLPNHLVLPSQEPNKPFHPHQQQQQHHHFTQQPQQHHFQRPVSIPINHQAQFSNQQAVIAHQQFNQPPQRLPPPQLSHTQAPQALQQQQPILKPPQRPAVSANFNQNQRPFNFHAHAPPQNQPQQVRFPNQPPPPPQQQQQHFQQHLQRPQQNVPPRISAPQQNFHSQQLVPHNRPPVQFNGPPFPQQQFPPQQGPPTNFKPEPKAPQLHHSQPLHVHNQFAHQQNQQQITSQNHNVFQGGLVEQAAPNLAGTRPTFPQPTFQTQEEKHFHHQQQQFIQSQFGNDVQVHSSVPKFEHHITETVNPPVLFQPTAIDMEKVLHKEKNIGPLAENIGHLSHSKESQHRFAVGQQTGGVSNHFSEVFPQFENQQKHYSHQTFAEIHGRNNFQSTPVSTTTTRRPTQKSTTTTTVKPSTTGKPPAYFDLPDEIPDDLRKQLEESGVLENAQISILDYDKLGDTSLQDLPPEHLANFFSHGGAAQIGASNKVISVVKPNGESVSDRLGVLRDSKDVAKLLGNAGKLPNKKEDVSLKIVKFDQSQMNIPEKYIQQNAKVLPTVNTNQNYSRYLPIKINGAQFPIPDAEELRGRKISSVVVLAPVAQDETNDGRQERDTFEAKHIKFLTGETLKNLIKKPSRENFRKWLDKEQKSPADSQSVVLLVTNDSAAKEQQIYMYDIVSKTVSHLSGELSSKFVNVAEENAAAQDESGTPLAEQIDRMDTFLEDEDAEPSNIVESVVTLDSRPVEEGENHQVLISSGYSVIKNE